MKACLSSGLFIRFENMRFITIAIHTYEKALALRSLLESEGITVELHNVNLEVPGLSSGVRVRIPETDLPLALRIIENKELFAHPGIDKDEGHTVLVPVDFSENSYKAAIVAANIAESRSAAVKFLYSYIDPYVAGNIQLTDALNYGVGEPGARRTLDELAQKQMQNFCDRFKSAMKRGEIPVVKYSSHVSEGVPEDSIVD